MNSEPITVLLVEDNPDDADLIRETLAENVPPEIELTRVKSLSDTLALQALRAGAQDYLVKGWIDSYW
jgi:CheY-like chemotaxis protein